MLAIELCISYSILTFDDEFGGCFYGASRGCGSAGEGASVLFVGCRYEQHSVIAFVNHLESGRFVSIRRRFDLPSIECNNEKTKQETCPRDRDGQNLFILARNRTFPLYCVFNFIFVFLLNTETLLFPLQSTQCWCDKDVSYLYANSIGIASIVYNHCIRLNFLASYEDFRKYLLLLPIQLKFNYL